jgi:hypothetical protein
VEEQQRLPDPCASSPGPAWSGPRWRPRVRHHEGAVDNAGRQVDRAARCQVLGPCLQEVPHDASLDPPAEPSKQIEPAGNRAGRSAHVAPMRSSHSTPLRTEDCAVVICERPATPVGPACRCWTQGRQYRLLCIGEFFSAYHTQKLTRSTTWEQDY